MKDPERGGLSRVRLNNQFGLWCRSERNVMSYTTVKAIWPSEKHEDLEELRNSHGSAPVIWGALCERYLGDRNQWLFKNDALWPLYKRDDVPACMRAVLMMTFDRAYVEKKDYAKAAADIEEFLRIAPPPENHVNHWPHIAALFKSDPDIPAIGFYCTSVSEDPFQGEWNDEKEDYEPPDWTRCWSVYDDEALRRLWPIIEGCTHNYVFTGERAGEVAADMAALRCAALASVDEQPAEPVQEPVESALARFESNGHTDELSPLERLRFFCSLAMTGQDWLDVEPFFDAVTTTQRQPLKAAQVADLWNSYKGGLNDFARIIKDVERAHGIGGDK